MLGPQNLGHQIKKTEIEIERDNLLLLAPWNQNPNPDAGVALAGSL